jgi:hypothetical protein
VARRWQLALAEDMTMATIDLQPLLQRAFFNFKVESTATEALEAVADEFARSTRGEGFHYEIVAPQDPDTEWLMERVLHPLVYFCQSRGTPMPQFPGVFVALFVGDRLHGIAVSEVLDWAHETLGVSPEELIAKYGTGEVETALR